jgi:transcription elongation factor Elf1
MANPRYDEEATCPGCGTRYRLTFTNERMRDKDKFVCRHCGEVYKSWNECRIWSVVQELPPLEPPKSN